MLKGGKPNVPKNRCVFEYIYICILYTHVNA